MEDLLKLPESQQLYEHQMAETYLFGRCYIFALALHNLYRYPMEFLWDAEAPWDGGTKMRVLVHAYCIRPDGTLVDVSGTVSREEVYTNHGRRIVRPQLLQVTKQELLEDFREGRLDPPDHQELWITRQFLCRNPDVFKHGLRKIIPLRKVNHAEQNRLYSAITALRPTT